MTFLPDQPHGRFTVTSLMRCPILVSLFVAAVLFSACSRNSGNGGSIAIGENRTVRSNLLNEDRHIVIYLPPGYPQQGIRYPVVYMLDGDSHFHHASGIIQFLTSSGVTAPLILVGVGNTDRTRDLTPSRLTDTLHRSLTSGGANTFLKFLTEELAGFMKSQYQVGPYKILVGHSLGGLFALHTFVTKPHSFNAYIAISPSLWWNKRSELESAKAFCESRPTVKNSLYMVVGNEGEGMIAASRGFARILQDAPIQDLRWKFVPMPNEDHGSIVHRALYDGLEFTFAPLNHLPEVACLDTAALSRYFVALSDELGYPVAASERLVARTGFRLLEEKKTQAAIALFQYNVKRFPELPDCYDHLVVAYEQSNQLELAIKSCEAGLEKARKASDPSVPYFEKSLADLKVRLARR
jgi:predicted alpha/beta superfamily hydrolase